MTPEEYFVEHARITELIAEREAQRAQLDVSFELEYGASINGVLTLPGLVKLLRKLGSVV